MIRLRLSAAPGFAAVVVMFALVAFIAGDGLTGAVGLAAAAVVLAGWWVWAGLVHRSYGWTLTDGTVELQHGVLLQRRVVMPRSGVQNVTKSSSPLARRLGLASVTVHSAGAATPNLMIPDLADDVGDELVVNLLPGS